METLKQNRKYEENLDAMEQIQRKMDEAEAKAKADIQALKEEQIRLSKVRYPLHMKKQAIFEQKERIERAKKKLEDHLPYIEEFSKASDAMIGDAGSSTIFDLYNNPCWAHSRHAQRAVDAIQDWLERNNAKLADMEKDAADYAKQHDIEHLLAPPEETPAPAPLPELPNHKRPSNPIM